jgi:hypothetical protein
VDTVDLMAEEFDDFEKNNPYMAIKLEEYFGTRPYYISCFFLEIVRYEDRPDF